MFRDTVHPCMCMCVCRDLLGVCEGEWAALRASLAETIERCRAEAVQRVQAARATVSLTVRSHSDLHLSTLNPELQQYQ